MKRIFPLLAVVLLLASCTACKTKPANLHTCEDAWYNLDSLKKIPTLHARIDSTFRNICPNYLPSVEDSVPFLAGEVTLLPLASTPGFRIGSIEKIETEGDLIFILATKAEDSEENASDEKDKEWGGFIFHKDGSLVAQLKRSDVCKENNIAIMAVNRQAKEVSIMWSEKWQDMADLLTYDYKGNLLRHQAVYCRCTNIMGYTQNHMINNEFPPFDVAPQLTICDQEGLPEGFTLFRPSKSLTNYIDAALTNCGDELFYSTAYSDTIWQVGPEGAVARYLVSGDSVGIGSLPFNNDSTITQSQRVLANENRYIPNVSYNLPLLVSPDFLLCRYVKNYNIKITVDTKEKCSWDSECSHTILVYDRKTGNSCWAWALFSKWTLPGLCVSGAQAIKTDGTLISSQTPAQLKYYLAHPEAAEFDSKTQAFVKKLDIGANPVLLLMPLKHF